MKKILWLALIPIVGVLLTWAFIEGRKEMEIERERERPIQVPPRVKNENGKTRVVLDEKTRALAGIETQRPSPEKGGLLLPRSAILRQEGAAWVFAEVARGEFERRSVQILRFGEERIVVSSDAIRPDAVVVTTGAQLLLSEELKSQIQVLGDEGGGH